MTLTKTLAVIDARDDELGADANVRFPPNPVIPNGNFRAGSLSGN
jgi:hypothetical protein